MAQIASTSTAETARAETAKKSEQLTGDLQSFLKLLTTQLQSQDPLNPTDSTEFVTQLALFSQAEQSVNTNKRLDTLIDLSSSQMLSGAANFLGKEVQATSDHASFDGSNAVRFSYEVPSGYSDVTVEIKNDAGKVIRSVSGKVDSGHYDDTWDGKTDGGATAPAGDYAINVTARQPAEGGVAQSRTLETAIAGRVSEMRVSDGTVSAVIGGREVPISKIAGISGTATAAN